MRYKIVNKDRGHAYNVQYLPDIYEMHGTYQLNKPIRNKKESKVTKFFKKIFKRV